MVTNWFMLQQIWSLGVKTQMKPLWKYKFWFWGEIWKSTQVEFWCQFSSPPSSILISHLSSLHGKTEKFNAFSLAPKSFWQRSSRDGDRWTCEYLRLRRRCLLINFEIVIISNNSCGESLTQLGKFMMLIRQHKYVNNVETYIHTHMWYGVHTKKLKIHWGGWNCLHNTQSNYQSILQWLPNFKW